VKRAKAAELGFSKVDRGPEIKWLGLDAGPLLEARAIRAINHRLSARGFGDEAIDVGLVERSGHFGLVPLVILDFTERQTR
jgi:hypothetical protein